MALQVSQSVMVGYFADSLANDSPESTQNAYLFAGGECMVSVLANKL